MLGLHLGLVTCRVLHEQRERQRVESVFGRIVSPKVRDELIQAQHLALGGVRREVTVLFADLRKFTQATDASQAAAEEHVRQHRLEGDAAREYLGQQAREVLTAVNRYLALIADKVKLHDGTLDKYIGDCVMAFWGAPAPNSRHAAACVRAMIEAQRTIHQLNRQAGANPPGRCASENAAGKPATEAPAPSLLFSVGMGINTGLATVGLIGSERHIFNYTVFGREVNLASRLEEIAAPGCVLIGESTFHALQRDDSELAALCAEQPPAVLKGFRAPVRLYAVKWQET
jgi:adenylate cyclase